MTLPLPAAIAALVLGYFLGAIPFGLFFAHLSGAGDVRKIGSGNIGATNVLRTGKKWAAAATLQGTRTTALFETLSSCSTASWLMLSGSQWPTGRSHGA